MAFLKKALVIEKYLLFIATLPAEQIQGLVEIKNLANFPLIESLIWQICSSDKKCTLLRPFLEKELFVMAISKKLNIHLLFAHAFSKTTIKDVAADACLQGLKAFVSTTTDLKHAFLAVKAMYILTAPVINTEEIRSIYTNLKAEQTFLGNKRLLKCLHHYLEETLTIQAAPLSNAYNFRINTSAPGTSS